ncbi:hypothetical protein ACFXPJ_02100, partial [Streptomyces goshikiensis]
PPRRPQPPPRSTARRPRSPPPRAAAAPPPDVRFSDHGSHTPVTAGRYGDQSAVVTFGPGRPVHFDIQVPGDARQVRADGASFTLRGPDGPIPGASFAEGALMVAPGTLVGPVEQGA